MQPDPFHRTQAVAFALNLTKNTPLAPDAYERLLLGKFARGTLTLDEMEHRLAQRTRR